MSKTKSESIKHKLDAMPLDLPIGANFSSVPKTARTSPGALGEFMQRESKVYSENQVLIKELELFKDALPSKMLVPSCIVPSRFANRLEESFTSIIFQNLKDEIFNAGGNVQPIKVRPVAGSTPQQYEIVYGHRRHRACLDLKLLVLATIEDLSDAELFQQMDRENRQRADLRPYEQGLMYARALDEGIFSSMRKMSESLGMEQANVSRYIALAKLPKEVLAAFASPLDLQQRWAASLTQALEMRPAVVHAQAKVLSSQTPRPKPSAIFEALIQTDSDVPNITTSFSPINVVGTSGQTGAISFDAKKKAFTISIKGVDQSRSLEIKKLLEQLISH